MLLPKTLIEHLGNQIHSHPINPLFLPLVINVELIDTKGGDRNVRKMMNELIEVFKNDISIGAHFTRLIEGVEEDTASRVF